MAAVAPSTKDVTKGDAPAPVEIHRIRITLTSRNVKALEKGECFLDILLCEREFSARML